MAKNKEPNIIVVDKEYIEVPKEDGFHIIGVIVCGALMVAAIVGIVATGCAAWEGANYGEANKDGPAQILQLYDYISGQQQEIDKLSRRLEKLEPKSKLPNQGWVYPVNTATCPPNTVCSYTGSVTNWTGGNWVAAK